MEERAKPAAPETEAATAHQEWLSLRSHLSCLFERLGVTCVMDVGANVGHFGNLVRSFGYDGWLISFEPVADIFAELRAAAAGDDRWRQFDFALGAREESREIGVAENSVLSSFLERSEYQVQQFGAMTSIVRKELVSVRTIDSVADECLDGIDRSRIFLKLDTQGWDLEVVKGAERLLPQIAGIQIEVALKSLYEGAPSFSRTISFLGDRGYEVTGLFTVVRDRSLRLIELDCVTARPELSWR